MRKLAIGILAAAGVALSVPASAQGVSIGAGPVGVGVGVGPGYGYYDGYRLRSALSQLRLRRRLQLSPSLPRRAQNFNGYVRKVRRCW